MKSSVALPLSLRRPSSYRNQFIDLRSKSIDWFLYDNCLRHVRVKQLIREYKIGMRLILLSKPRIFKHRIFNELPILWIAGFKRRKHWIKLYQLKTVWPSEHFVNQSVKTLFQISVLRLWYLTIKFGHEINLKGLMFLMLLD